MVRRTPIDLRSLPLYWNRSMKVRSLAIYRCSRLGPFCSSPIRFACMFFCFPYSMAVAFFPIAPDESGALIAVARVKDGFMGLFPQNVQDQIKIGAENIMHEAMKVMKAQSAVMMLPVPQQEENMEDV